MITFEIVKNELLKNPLTFTSNVLLETTNRCNYSNLHSKCPANLFTEKKTMSIVLIESVLRQLGEWHFNGIIYPFNYSEPLIDPRFFKILELIKKFVPLVKIWIYTNGFMVDENLLNELSKAGLDRINFSAYSQGESKFIHQLIISNRDKLPMVMRAYKRYPFEEYMNDKLDWYDRKPISYVRSCPSPYRFLTINCHGELQICCHDWKRMHVFGNLNSENLFDILLKENTIQTFVDLMNKKRDKYYLCARCNKHR